MVVPETDQVTHHRVPLSLFVVRCGLDVLPLLGFVVRLIVTLLFAFGRLAGAFPRAGPPVTSGTSWISGRIDFTILCISGRVISSFLWILAPLFSATTLIVARIDIAIW